VNQATTIDLPAYWTYHLVNLGISGAMLSPPTLSKTFGVISPEAISASRSPEAPPRRELDRDSAGRSVIRAFARQSGWAPLRG
jgi:hypothetical protein